MAKKIKKPTYNKLFVLTLSIAIPFLSKTEILCVGAMKTLLNEFDKNGLPN
jgi:hypothetical protein